MFIYVVNLLDEILMLVSLISYESQQRESHWLDRFGIFYNKTCVYLYDSLSACIAKRLFYLH